MKKILLFFTALCIGTFSSLDSYACRNSNCKPCPDGFSYTKKCCKSSNRNECIVLGDEIEECGVGQWKAYPHSLPIVSSECCTSSTEGNCRYLGDNKDLCGTGKMEEYPYSPLRKCCKDTEEKDCVTIKAKRRCGKYQLKDYPEGESDCCNSDLTECTGSVRMCPRCR